MPKIHQREALITKADREGIYSFQASTEKVDSYGDIVVQEGIDLSRFKKNPIILYQHNSDEPIGQAVDVRVEKKGLVADVELAPRGISERIDTIRGLLDAGILKAVSIGFTVKPDGYKAIRNDDNEVTGFRFLKSLLHEISVVSIPANDDALAIARSHGMTDKQISRLFSESKALQAIKRRKRFITLHKGTLK